MGSGRWRYGVATHWSDTHAVDYGAEGSGNTVISLRGVQSVCTVASASSSSSSSSTLKQAACS
jgi:hypothetical protein